MLEWELISLESLEKDRPGDEQEYYGTLGIILSEKDRQYMNVKSAVKILPIHHNKNSKKIKPARHSKRNAKRLPAKHNGKAIQAAYNKRRELADLEHAKNIKRAQKIDEDMKQKGKSRKKLLRTLTRKQRK